MPIRPLDAIDRKILIHLQSDARTTNQHLSQAVGLSPSPCLRRVRQLEDEGVITGYAALVSPEAVGLPVSAFVHVRLRSQDDRNLAEFESAIVAFPEVMECYLMSGDNDYQLRVVVESLGAFEDFLRHSLTHIASVAGVNSSFALRPIVYRTALPIDIARHAIPRQSPIK